jgi:hypothetical protein
MMALQESVLMVIVHLNANDVLANLCSHHLVVKKIELDLRAVSQLKADACIIVDLTQTLINMNGGILQQDMAIVVQKKIDEVVGKFAKVDFNFHSDFVNFILCIGNA